MANELPSGIGLGTPGIRDTSLNCSRIPRLPWRRFDSDSTEVGEPKIRSIFAGPAFAPADSVFSAFEFRRSHLSIQIVEYRAQRGESLTARADMDRIPSEAFTWGEV